MDDEIPSRSLAIYFSKDRRTPKSLIRSRAQTKEFTIPVGGSVQGRLLIKRPESKPPRWTDFFKDYVDATAFGENSSCSAVLLVPVLSRWAAVTFGQGRHLLAPDAFEERFGLRVTLNCLDETKIRSIDKHRFDSIGRHSRDQASHDANAGEFGFDIERDMLRAVTGTPRNTDDFGRFLTGVDSLNAHVQIELPQLYELLESFHRKFFETAYQKNFSWVDKIGEVTDPGLKTVLDDAVIQMIRSGNFDRCWLAVPDIIDWSIVDGFRYSLGRKSPERHDIHLTTFLESRRNPSQITKAGLKTKKVFCVGDNDTIMKSWSVFNCLYCELEHNESSYVLSGGKWYRLDSDFVKQVNDSFAAIPRYGGTFLDYNDDNEEEYNARLADSDPDRYCLMDRKLTYRGGPIELCDIFSRDKEFIHVKRYGGSSVLSHLFSQGLVSGEFFHTDSDFRELILNKLPERYRVFDKAARPHSEEYHIIFAIISQSDKPLGVPFFSRVAVRHAARRLTGFGYKVSLAKIAVADTRKRLQRIKPLKSKP